MHIQNVSRSPTECERRQATCLLHLPHYVFIISPAMTQQQQQQLRQQRQPLLQLQLQQKQLRQPADGTGVHFLAFILWCLGITFY